MRFFIRMSELLQVSSHQLIINKRSIAGSYYPRKCFGSDGKPQTSSRVPAALRMICSKHHWIVHDDIWSFCHWDKLDVQKD